MHWVKIEEKLFVVFVVGALIFIFNVTLDKDRDINLVQTLQDHEPPNANYQIIQIGNIAAAANTTGTTSYSDVATRFRLS